MAVGLGLDVGGTKVLGCALDERGVLAAEVRLSSPKTLDGAVDALVGCVRELLDGLGQRRDEVTGIGLGLPGLVSDDGVLHETANMHGVEGLSLRASLASRLEELRASAGLSASPPWRLVADNDGTCAAAGELAFGAARGCSDAVVVTLGTGIGGGIIANGRMLRGARRFAAEIGHMVVDVDGPPCGCGRFGCWEQFASGTGLAHLARQRCAEGGAARLCALAGGGPEAVRGEHVVAAAREGDPDALVVIEQFGRYLATGLANLAEVLDPGRIILGGGLVQAGDLLLGPGLATYAATTRRGSGARSVPVVIAELGERAGAYGAAALGLDLVP